MIKCIDIIKRFRKKPHNLQTSQKKEVRRVGYGYMKRRLGLLSDEANALLEDQRSGVSKS